MLLTINILDLINLNKTDQTTGEIIQIPDVIIDYNKTISDVDLVSHMLIPYARKR